MNWRCWLGWHWWTEHNLKPRRPNREGIGQYGTGIYELRMCSMCCKRQQWFRAHWGDITVEAYVVLQRKSFSEQAYELFDGRLYERGGKALRELKAAAAAQEEQDALQRWAWK